MSKKGLTILLFIIFDFVLVLYVILLGKNIELLNPAGVISYGERHTIFALTVLMLFIAIPMLITLFYTLWKYREGNSKAKYEPDGKSNFVAHALWWVVPTILIFLMAIVSWNATHALDPYKPISSNVKPITVQVIALDWKWLFIYPEQNIATVNFLELPVDTPINFELTADAPMNSFWIPQLTGQIYAMTGMSSKLHILATKLGDYNGSAAEINGKGFSEMRFVTRVASESDFNGWVLSTQNTSKPLDHEQYEVLIKPSQNSPQQFFSPVDKTIYNSTINKYMKHSVIEEEEHHHSH